MPPPCVREEAMWWWWAVVWSWGKDGGRRAWLEGASDSLSAAAACPPLWTLRTCIHPTPVNTQSDPSTTTGKRTRSWPALACVL